MTINDLYSACDNMTSTTVFHIIVDFVEVAQNTFIDYPIEYDSQPIHNFQFIDERNVKVYYW